MQKKTEAMWLGASKGVKLKPLNLKWKECVKILGISFSYDTTEAFNRNYNEKLQNLEKTLNLWKMRDLTLMGRVLIAKSLGMSKLVYTASVADINDTIVKEVNRLIYDFIWKGKRPRIKKSTLIGDLSEGGLRAPDFETVVQAQRAMWIKRYLDSNEALWKATLDYYLKDFGKTFLLHCNFDTDILSNKVPAFYRDGLKNWLKCMKILKYRQTLGTQIVWNNNLIKIQDKSVYFSDFRQAGLWTVADLYAGTHLINFEVWNKRGISAERYLNWRGLIAAIPKDMKQEVVQNSGKNEKVELIINGKKNFKDVKSCDFYQILINDKFIKASAQRHYREQISTENWKDIYSLPRKVLTDTRTINFQYKCLHRLIPTNDFLFLIGKRRDKKCSFCRHTDDSFEHIFFYCPIIQNFWQTILSNVLRPLGITSINEEDIFFGFNFSKPPKLANQIVIIAKDHIVSEKYNERTPNFESYRVKFLDFVFLQEKAGTLDKDWNIIENMF